MNALRFSLWTLGCVVFVSMIAWMDGQTLAFFGFMGFAGFMIWIGGIKRQNDATIRTLDYASLELANAQMRAISRGYLKGEIDDETWTRLMTDVERRYRAK